MSGRREVPDPRPVAWPIGLDRPLTIQEEIQRFVRVEMSKRAQEHGFETFEEADDFAVEDEDEFISPYEMTELQEDARFSPAEPPLTSAPEVSESVSNKTNPDNAGSVPGTSGNLTNASETAPSTVPKT